MGLHLTFRWVLEIMRSCRASQLFNRLQPSSPFESWRAPQRPGEAFDLDFMGLFSKMKVGKRHFLLVIIDMIIGIGVTWAMKVVGG